MEGQRHNTPPILHFPKLTSLIVTYHTENYHTTYRKKLVTLQVTLAVSVTVLESPRPNLINQSGLPPFLVCQSGTGRSSDQKAQAEQQDATELTHLIDRRGKFGSRSAISSCYIYFWQKPGYRFIYRYRDHSRVLIAIIPCPKYVGTASLFTFYKNRDVPLIPVAQANHRSR